nr:P-loop NTPase [Allobranchiibius sp. GilTou38]
MGWRICDRPVVVRASTSDQRRAGPRPAGSVVKSASTASESQVRRVVGDLLDPELHHTFAALQMVREVRIDRRGRASVRIALTTRGCPMTENIRAAVVQAVRGTGIDRVDVSFDVMSEEERQAAADVAVPVHGLGAAPAPAVYAIASGKGGVGKSTVAANLAVALATHGKRVGLLDADVWGYSVPQLFGVRHSPVVLNGRMLPVRAHGVSLMSLGFFVKENEPIVWRGPMLHKALSQFVTETHWGDLDVLVLDLPPGTGDVTLSVLELLPDAALVAVTTPQAAARTVASRVGAMAREVHMPIAGVVENMAELICAHCGSQTPLFGSGGGEELARELGTPLLGRIPLDVQLRQAGDAGVPVVLSAPRSGSALTLSDIAARLRPVRRPLVGRQLGLTPVSSNPR